METTEWRKLGGLSRPLELGHITAEDIMDMVVMPAIAAVGVPVPLAIATSMLTHSDTIGFGVAFTSAVVMGLLHATRPLRDGFLFQRPIARGGDTVVKELPPEPTPEPAPARQNYAIERIELLQRALDARGILFTVDGCDPDSSTSVDLFNLKPNKAGLKLNDTDFGDDFARDTALPRNASRIGVINNAGNGMARLILPKPVREYINYDISVITDEGKILPVHIGATLDGVQQLDLTELPHVAIGGTTRSGKTIFALTVLLTMGHLRSPKHVNYWLADGKMVTFPLIKTLPHVTRPIAVDYDQFIELLNDAEDELNRRNTLFAASGSQNIMDYHDAGNTLPYIVIGCDELSLLLDNGDKKDWVNALNKLTKLAKAGRSVGIHLMLIDQTFERKTYPSRLMENVPTGVCFAVGSKHASKQVIKVDGAETLLGKGDGLAFTVGDYEATRFQSLFISTEGVKEEVKKIAKKWL